MWAEIADVVLPAMLRYRARISSVTVTRKADGTLLSEADVAVQELIVGVLRRRDPGALIVAEEGANVLAPTQVGGRVWVVDPIDGTSQFLDPRRREFCSVVAVLEAGIPAGCMILAPELGWGRSPVLLTSDGEGGLPLLGDRPAAPARRTRLVSTTRSSVGPASPAELLAARSGLVTKTGATSLTLDMARTSVDLTAATGLPSFRWFVAARPLLWDWAAGAALARATGRAVVDGRGQPIVPVAAGLIAGTDPRVPATIVGQARDVGWILAHTPSATRGTGSAGTADA